jgi:membrane-associated phospholipid phosphatase
MSTFEGITHSWDEALARPKRKQDGSSRNVRDEMFVSFETYEDFFQDHIIDYNIDTLFQPIRLETAQPVVIKDATDSVDLFTIMHPSVVDDNVRRERQTQQMAWVKSAAAQRDERFDEIMVQQTDILSFFSALVGLDDARTPWTLVLLDAVLRFGTYIEMPMKLHYGVARPNQLSSIVQPIIQPPTHGSFPSGHAVEAYAIAAVLYALVENTGVPKTGDGAGVFDALSAFNHSNRQKVKNVDKNDDAEQLLLMRLAARIAENRTVAGVHFPADSFAGAGMGLAIGEYLVNALQGNSGTGAYSVSFDHKRAGGGYKALHSIFAYDFRHDTFPFLGTNHDATTPTQNDVLRRVPKTINPNALNVSPILQEIWRQARREMASSTFFEKLP